MPEILPLDGPARFDAPIRKGVPLAVVVVLAFTLAIPIAVVLAAPGQSLPVLAGVLSGIPAGVLVAWVIYALQVPQLGVVVDPIPTAGNRDTWWLHFLVSNHSVGFLGAGAATGVQAILTMPDRPQLVFHLKWDSKPDPLEYHLAPGGQLAQLPNPHLYDLVGTETVRGRPKGIGALFKFQGFKDAWIHEPSTFDNVDWRNPYARLEPGKHRLAITLEHDTGSAGPFRFTVVNEDSVDKKSIRIVPGWPP
ncbi:MAG TPA: hypothetical protein VGU43_07445 [Thermoplasmata archaeon]|nr:hypothetical protein [Thermoplasmata archaeon]